MAGARVSIVGVVVACALCIGLSVVGTAWYVSDIYEEDLGEVTLYPEKESVKNGADNSLPETRKPTVWDEADRSGGTVRATHDPDRPVYRLEVGDKHTYRIEITAGDAKQHRTTDSCVYQVMNGTLDRWEDRETSGTAFVVSSQGHMATCAHVVDKASRVEVTLGEEKYEARVVALNEEKDLAILKVEPVGSLVPCPLGDSSRVELAESVRAFGYPLSDVLGTDLKVVSGSVSGITETSEVGRRIQTDAPVNPGNSGGPLVNDVGQVVGVISQKLSSRLASSVGLATPVDELKKMLHDIGVQPVETAPVEGLSGPELAKRITPGVAYVRVNGIEGRVFDLNFRVEMNERRSIRSALDALRFHNQPQWDGSMMLTEYGEIVKEEGESPALAFLLGPASRFCLTPLDYLGRSEWTQERDVLLQFYEQRSTDPFSVLLNLRQRSFGRSMSPKPPKLIPAEEMVRFKLKSGEAPGQFVVHRKYRLAVSSEDDQSPLVIEGTGETTFDTKLGMPLHGTYSGKVTQATGSDTSSIPINVEFGRADSPDTREKIRLGRTEKVTVQGQAKIIVTTVNTLRSDGAVVSTKTTERVGPDGRIQSGTETIVRLKGTVIVLPEEVKPDDSLPDSSNLEIAVQQLGDTSKSFHASRLLVKAGVQGEVAVLTKIESITDSGHLTRAINVLSEIGTEKSIPILKKLEDSGNAFAQSAIVRISIRHGLEL